MANVTLQAASADRKAPAPVQLAILVGVGAATYGGWLALFARGTVRELIAILRKRPMPA